MATQNNILAKYHNRNPNSRVRYVDIRRAFDQELIILLRDLNHDIEAIEKQLQNPPATKLVHGKHVKHGWRNSTWRALQFKKGLQEDVEDEMRVRRDERQNRRAVYERPERS